MVKQLYEITVHAVFLSGCLPTTAPHGLNIYFQCRTLSLFSNFVNFKDLQFWIVYLFTSRKFCKDGTIFFAVKTRLGSLKGFYIEIKKVEISIKKIPRKAPVSVFLQVKKYRHKVYRIPWA